ncbi:hypothetical protein SpCBS45565_g03913 [Spizellomyces sp. 'palustris']|nr:hypothetical protein SpCBS45565_g03913 [Spizellomyces sp. 'palustris']
MHIKQIIIQGFKSYKDQTALEPFSPKLNVVVGRNGSGKSNFFWAIRFALNDAYSHMTREERQSLLHEGTGPATLSAFVEVVFDNTDQRFPTGKDEVVLRRTIGLKKDEYALDKKSVTKTEVMSLFETAGFSRSNPYYIVPQGRITALTNAKDAERLQLLKEVAGTRIYEQRRMESLKIMEETDSKRSKIDQLLNYIEERLAELEEEKEELKQYQEQDRERRCLEYTIYSREQSEVNENLEELEEARRNEVDELNQRQSQSNDREGIVTNMERTIRDVKKKVDMLSVEREQVDDDRNEQIKAKAHLELIIKDSEENVSTNLQAKERLTQDLNTLREKIAEKERELDEVSPSFNEALTMENSLKERYEAAELERDTLYSKQGRNAQFRTKAERDTYLRKEIKNVQDTITSQSQQVTQLEQEVVVSRRRLAEIDTGIEDTRQQLEDRKQKLTDIDQQILDLRRQRNQLDERRKELWRDESKHSASAQTAKEELDRCERILYSSMDRVTGEALRALKRITERLNLRGVYGPLYELFEIDDRYKTAVEVVAGGSLFHVVVDNDDTATRIVEQLNREKCGRLTLMPLNRLKPRLPQYPDARDAVIMVQKLQFDRTFKPAFDQVFGKAIICPSLEIASAYARSHGLNSVTLDGDRADRKGALTGGYMDHRRARLENIKKLKKFRETYAEDELAASRLREEIAKVEQEITRTRDQLAQLDARRRQTMDSREPLMNEINSKLREKSTLEELIARKESSLQSLQGSIRNLTTQLQTYEAELKSPFTKTLTNQEQARLDEVNAAVEELQQQLREASKRRASLESRKTILEIELNTNLRRKRDDAVAQLDNASFEGEVGVQLRSRQQELATVEKAIERAARRLEEIEAEMEEQTAMLQEQTQGLETARTEQQQERRVLERQRIVVEKYISKKASLLKRKEECIKNIRDLGVLPEEAFEKYQNAPTKTLLKKLHQVNEALKKYSHVNKKAFEQYGNFAKQRDQLEIRKEELDKSAGAIEDLIKNLDQRKDEAIERTFRQVAKYFQEVWSKLVQSGRGELIMLRRADGSSQTQDDNDENGSDQEESSTFPTSKAGRTHSIIDQYTGISISVSFNSPTDEGLRMPQLSGGQKSLVALALIFAIQRCDPAPFYLFDEIDAALDAQYRTAVAAMINELSSSAQFIVTTFRPELLAYADKCYGVTFVNKVSRIQSITRDDALKFVEETAAGAQ